MTWNSCINARFTRLFQFFPTGVAQNDLERPNSLRFVNIFQVLIPSLKWLRMTWNYQFRHLDSQLFQSFPTKVAQNDIGMTNFAPVCTTVSNLFPPKWLGYWPISPDLQLFQSDSQSRSCAQT